MQNSWISRLLPAATNTRPTEWSRAAIGVSLGTLLCVWVCSLFFGLPVAMHLIGPLGASAILLFAVSSGALAQPWSIVGGYLCATVVSLGVVHFFGRNLDSACLAVGLAMLIMCLLRCLLGGCFIRRTVGQNAARARFFVRVSAFTADGHGVRDRCFRLRQRAFRGGEVRPGFMRKFAFKR